MNFINLRNMENEFLASLQPEGLITETPAELEKEEKEAPPESPADNKPKEEQPAPPAEEVKGESPKEGVEPEVFHAFHEHPRWIAMQEELKELREFREQAAPLLEEKPSEKSAEVPRWFETAFGRNEELWSEYSRYNTEERNKVRNEVLEEVRQQEAQRLTEQKESDKWVEAGIKELEAEGLKFDRNELMKTALDYLPSDEKGNISIRKSYDILRATKAQPQANPSTDKKKQVADMTIKKSTPAEEKKDYRTWQDFQGKDRADLLGL